MTNYSVIGESSDGYPMAWAWLPSKNERKIRKRRAVGHKAVKIVRDDGNGHVLVLVRRGNRWQHEEVKRELLV